MILIIWRNRTIMKSDARHKARQRRRALSTPDAGQKLASHLPDDIKTHIIAGFSPIRDEIDVWPLLKALHSDRHRIVLPVIINPKQPLIFNAASAWAMAADIMTGHCKPYAAKVRFLLAASPMQGKRWNHYPRTYMMNGWTVF